MTDGMTADHLTGITVITAPRGSGKSHLLSRSVAEARERGKTAVWIDASDTGSDTEVVPADLTVVDAIDPRDPSHLSLMRSVVAAFRNGSVGRVMFASRSGRLRDHHLHPWLHDYTSITADALAIDAAQVVAMAYRAGVSISARQAELIAEESGGWAWAASIGIDVTRGGPPPRTTDLQRTMRMRIRDAVTDRLTHQQRLILTATTTVHGGALRAVGVSDPDAWLAKAESDGWLIRDAFDDFSRVPVALTRALRTPPNGPRDTLRGLHQRLLQWCLSEGRHAAAIDIAIASDDPSLVQKVIYHAAQSGRIVDVYRLAEAIEGRDIEWFGEHTDLLGAAAFMGSGESRNYADWQQSAKEVLKAAPTTRPQSPIDELYSLSVRIVAHRSVGELASSIECANRAIGVWRRARTRLPAAAAAAALALNAAAVTFLLNNEYVRALNTVADAVNCARMAGDPGLVFMNLSTQITVNILHGDLRAAEKALQELPDLEDSELPPVTLGHVGQAILAAERGDMAAAYSHAERTIEGKRNTELWWLGHFARATVSHVGGSRRADHSYETDIRQGVRQGHTINAADFHGLRLSKLQIVAGKFARARTTLARLDRDLPQRGILNAVIDLALGNWSEAQRLARPAPTDSTPRTTAIRGLVMTAATWSGGRHALASDFLASTLDRMIDWNLGSPLRFFTEASRDHFVAASERLDPRQRAFLLDQLARHAALASIHRVSAPLSARESDVIRLLGADKTLTDVAAALEISHNTVKTLSRRLYHKLGARSRREAIDNALAAGLLDDDLL